MKKFLAFVITLLCAVQGWAANPSFQSFDTNDFIAVAPTVKLRHSVDTGTNIFNNFIIINTNTVIVNTETHVTNVFTSIFNSFVTNVTDNSVTIITNSINNVTFTTNFIDNSTIVISNTFVIFTNTSVTIDGTNVPTINPTIGRIPYKSGTNSFDDSALYFIDPATVGANEVDVNTVGVTNLVTGGVIASIDSGSGYGVLTNVPAGTGALLNDGANNLSWGTVGTINPTDNFIPFRTNSSTFSDSPLSVTNGGTIMQSYNGTSFSMWQTNGNFAGANVYAALPGEATDTNVTVLGGALMARSGVINAYVPSMGVGLFSQGHGLTLTTISNATALHTYERSPQITLRAKHWNGAANVGPNAFFILSPPTASTNTADTTLDLYSVAGETGTGSSPSLSFKTHTTNSGIVFGPGTTNVLYRSDTGLIYTNGETSAAGVSITVIDGVGGGASVGPRSNAATLESTGTSTYVQLKDSSARVVKWLGGRLLPGDVNYDLGGAGSGNAWKNLVIDGTASVYGFASGTNLTKVDVSVTGTNAWDRVLINSTSIGTAGTAGRPIAFTNAPVVLPGFTKAQKATLTTQEGMIVFQTDNTPGIRVYQSGAWVMVSTVADP